MANMKKGERYAYAFAQIKKARTEGFSFEAIALCESIIADRLWSNVASRNKGVQGKILDSLLKKAREHLPADLHNRLDEWRKQRNVAIHEFVKSEPGTAPKGSLDEALKQAKQTAREGEKLAREVCKWHRSELNKAKKGAQR